MVENRRVSAKIVEAEKELRSLLDEKFKIKLNSGTLPAS